MGDFLQPGRRDRLEADLVCDDQAAAPACRSTTTSTTAVPIQRSALAPSFGQPARHSFGAAINTGVHPTTRAGESSTRLMRSASPGSATANGLDRGETAVAAARGSAGAPLSDDTRAGFSRSLGAGLDGVRVHTDASAQTAASSVGARAFTVGNDIFFGGGQYDPSSNSGKLLLAHELVHTVQQAGGTRTGQAQFKLDVSEPGDSLEQEADRLAPEIVAGNAVSVGGGGSTGAVMRWATEPSQAVQARLQIENAIRSARSAEQIEGIVRALEEPSVSTGLVTVRLPHDSPMVVVDIDLPPLVDEARARQRQLGNRCGGPDEHATPPASGSRTAPATGSTPHPAHPASTETATMPAPAAHPGHDGADPHVDTATGAATVRTAIGQADRLDQINAIIHAVEYASYDRAGDELPVQLETGSASRVVSVSRADQPLLLEEARERRLVIAHDDAAAARDRHMGALYDRERADAERVRTEPATREATRRRELDEQRTAEVADREARGLAMVRTTIAAHSDSLTREHLRDSLRNATLDHGLYHPTLPDAQHPEHQAELDAEDRTTAIRLAEESVAAAREAERASGHCRTPEGDPSTLTGDQRTDLIRRIGDRIVECGGAFDSAVQAVGNELRSAASADRDMAKLIFKICFTVMTAELPGLPVGAKTAISVLGALGEFAAGQHAAALVGAHDATTFLTVVQDGERLGRDAISHDLNCHTVEELDAVSENYGRIITQGQAYYERRLRAMIYNYQHQVESIGSLTVVPPTDQMGMSGMTIRGELAWVHVGGHQYLATITNVMGAVSSSQSFNSWVFRDYARMALAHHETEGRPITEIESANVVNVTPPPDYVYRRDEPLPEDRPPPAH